MCRITALQHEHVRKRHACCRDLYRDEARRRRWEIGVLASQDVARVAKPVCSPRAHCTVPSSDSAANCFPPLPTLEPLDLSIATFSGPHRKCSGRPHEFALLVRGMPAASLARHDHFENAWRAIADFEPNDVTHPLLMRRLHRPAQMAESEETAVKGIESRRWNE
jgi:hypothetical protein